MTTLHEDALKLQELLSVPERWTKHDLAKDACGNSVQPGSHAAVCWCLVGAAKKVSFYDSGRLVDSMLKSVPDQSIRITLFNDNIDHPRLVAFLEAFVESTK